MFSCMLAGFDAPSCGTALKLNLGGERGGAELDVMDNPASIITQVSRDEEGSKAAAERGEWGYF